MKRMLFIILIVVLGLLFQFGCNGNKHNLTGKWEAVVKYSNGKMFTPNWDFKEDGSFYEYVDEAWGSYKVKGDTIKITSIDRTQIYSGTITSRTHMKGELIYVGYEDKGIKVTWEAVKVDE
jgi:hypothetical protein